MLTRSTPAMVWELRTAWATGRRVALSLDDRCVVERVEGVVDRVAATGIYVVVDGLHVPTERVLAVHRPSRLGDASRDAA